MKQAEHIAEPETERLHALYGHFLAARCCRMHALYYAIRVIEREAGRSFDAAPVCKEPRQCEADAKRAWPTRPRSQERRAA